jgi:hypothetical protein
MKGSTMDAMSEAVDAAEVMLFGVSKEYKESGNCRLEAQYAHQKGVDMIPLVMTKSYNANGWLGLILGSKLYYSFYDAPDLDETAFEARVDKLVREIGDRCNKTAGVSSAVAEALPLATTHAATARPKASPASAPDPASAQAPAATPAAVEKMEMSQMTPDADRSRNNFSPSLRLASPGPTTAQWTRSTDDASLVVLLLEREERMREAAEAARQEAKAEKAELMQEMQRQMEAQREVLQRQMEALAPAPPAEVVTPAELAALQERVQRLGEAGLWQEAEMFAVEDSVSDYIEFRAQVGRVTLEVAQASPRVVRAVKHLAGLLTHRVPGVPQDPLAHPSGPQAPSLDSLKRTGNPSGTPWLWPPGPLAERELSPQAPGRAVGGHGERRGLRAAGAQEVPVNAISACWEDGLSMPLEENTIASHTCEACMITITSKKHPPLAHTTVLLQ